MIFRPWGVCLVCIGSLCHLNYPGVLLLTFWIPLYFQWQHAIIAYSCVVILITIILFIVISLFLFVLVSDMIFFWCIMGTLRVATEFWFVGFLCIPIFCVPTHNTQSIKKLGHPPKNSLHHGKEKAYWKANSCSSSKLQLRKGINRIRPGVIADLHCHQYLIGVAKEIQNKDIKAQCFVDMLLPQRAKFATVVPPRPPPCQPPVVQ